MKAMNIKAILLAVSLIGVAASANAADIAAQYDADSSTDLAQVYTFQSTGLKNGTFNDWISFSVENYGDLSASLSGAGSKAITFTAFNLYSSKTDSTPLSVGDLLQYSAKLAYGGIEVDSISPATYWINVKGTYTGVASYNGNITLTAAVPEPSTYGMLALGLGLIGFAARSRSKFSA